MVDRWVRVSDGDACEKARRITGGEGILSGGSCGTALIAALDEARRIMREEGAAARDKVLVVIFPDGGRNYLSKLYNDEWMRANGMLTATGAAARVDELLRARGHGPDLPDVILARTTDRVGAAIDLLQLYGISQLPVSERPDDDAIEGIVGSVSEKGLLDRTYRDPATVERTVGEVMDPPLPTVDLSATIDEAFGLLSGGSPAVVAARGGRPAGVVTKLDILEYLAHRAPRAD
jgi:cystathionine beta-synthase